MSKRKYFGNEGTDLLSKLSSVTGYYPITNKGLLHSGIHITHSDSTLITNPVEGTIVACSTDPEKDDSYFVVKNNITIPVSSKENKSIPYYSIISHLQSYSNYSAIVEHNKNLIKKASRDEINLLKKGLPIGITAKINTSVSTCRYMYLEQLKIKKYENSEIGVNLLGTKVGDLRSLKSQEIPIPVCDNTDAYIMFEEMEIKNGSKSLMTIKKGVPITVSSSTSFTVSGKSIVANKDVEKEIGYIYVDDNDYKINEFGNITVDSLVKDKQVYFVKQSEANGVDHDAFLMEKTEEVKIKSSLATITHVIDDRKKTKVRDNEYVEFKERSSIHPFYSGTYTDLFLRKLFLESLLQLFSIRDRIILINVSESLFFPRSNLSDTINKMMPGERKVEIGVDRSRDTNEYEYLLEDDKDRCFVVKLTCFQGALHDSIVPLLDSISVSSRGLGPDIKLTKLLKRQIPDYFNAFKVQVANKDIWNNAYLGKKGIFQCRPYLLTGRDYTIPLDDSAKNRIFNRCIIKTLKGYSRVISDTNVSFLYDSIIPRQVDDTKFTQYNAVPLDIINGDKNVTNLFDVFDQIDEIDEMHDPGEKTEIWCKLDTGYVVIPKHALEIWIEYVPTDSLKGKSVYSNSYLGFPKDASSGYPFVDWALFFTKSFFDVKPDLCTVHLPEGLECSTVSLSKKDLNKEIYLPIITSIVTTPVGGLDSVIKLESVICSIYVYEIAKKSRKNQLTRDKRYCSIDLQRFFVGNMPLTVENKLFANFASESDLNKFKSGHTFPDFPSEDQFAKVKKFYDDLILSQIFDKVPYKDKSNDAFFETSGSLYRFEVEITAKEICDAYGIQEPLYIDQEVTKNVTSKGGLFKVYSVEKEYTPCKLEKPFDKDKASCRSIDGNTYEIVIGNATYVIEKSVFEQHMTNDLETYFNSIITLNFPDAHGNMMLDTAMCPTDKLVCDLPKIKPKLQAITGLVDCIEKVESNLLYKQDGYSNGLEIFFKNTMSKHPLEQSKEVQDAISNADKSRLGLTAFGDTVNDIYKDLNTIDVAVFKDNSFHFIYPPSFFDKIDESGLLSVNPYVGRTISVNKSGMILETVLEKDIKSNPGFAPLCGRNYWGKEDEKIYYQDKLLGYCTGLFNQKRTIDIHTGIDIATGGENTDVISFIHGKVWATTWAGTPDLTSSYGKVMIIKHATEDVFYLLGHLLDYCKQVDDSVYPGDVVAITGTTGNSTGIHLHLEVRECNSLAKNEILARNANNKEITKPGLKWVDNTPPPVINPFDYSKGFNK